jgi:hypothetical protein
VYALIREPVAFTEMSPNTTALLNERVPLTSRCPQCRRERPQHDRIGGELLELLNTGRAISAYCDLLEATWSLSDRERKGIAERI